MEMETKAKPQIANPTPATPVLELYYFLIAQPLGWRLLHMDCECVSECVSECVCE